MQIIQEDDGKRGAFMAIQDGEQAGLMTYVWNADDQFIIEHTEVESAFTGQGVGKKLVMAAVDFARANNYKIIPLCPFAKSVFEKIPDIQDVI